MHQADIKQHIRTALRTRGVSYAAVAQQMGVTRNYVYKLLNEHAQSRDITPNHLAHIADAVCGRPVSTLTLLSLISDAEHVEATDAADATQSDPERSHAG